MGKLYIPTSTLNFNNILATEAISPESFYLNRNFGYKRFTKVEPNLFSNSIIAYNKLPIFKIMESDFDDYPMIIEISSELINKDSVGDTFEKDGIKIFQINRTIYLHPMKVKFIFFDENERKITLIKAEPSIETKLLPVYRNRLELIKNDYNSFQWKKPFLENIKDLPNDKIQENIRYDLMINKLKGFYYSYFLGIILSLSFKPKPLTEEFRTIIKLIVEFNNKKNKSISIDKRFIDELNELKLKINESEGDKNVSSEELIKAIYLEDSGIKEQQKLIEFLKLPKLGKDNFYNQLERNIQKIKGDNKINVLIDNLIECTKVYNSDELLLLKSERITKYLSSIKQREIKKNDPLFVIENINFNGYKVTQLSDDFYKKRGAELYQNIINDILEYPINDIQSFLEEKVNLTLRIGEVLKDFVEDWENSTYRFYLNSLLDNIEKFQPFNIKSHPSIILQSIAVFILKGDDPEKLIEAIRQNGISDYRIALGLWGAIFGFSSLPKTLINKLFEENYIDKTEHFYQNTQKKIHNTISSASLNIERVVIKQQPIIEDNSNNKRIKSKYKTEPKQKTEFSYNTKRKFKCPICGADMVLRKHNYGDFWGCKEYPKTKCLGKRDLRGYELNDKFKVVNKSKSISGNSNYDKAVLDFVNQKGKCKVSELNKELKKQFSTYSFNIGQAENYIKENLGDKIEIIKIGKSIGVKIRENEIKFE